MMKLQFVPADLTCTEMQQSWHKPHPIEIKEAPVMNVLFSKAKQYEAARRDPVLCSLYEAHAKCVQEYNFEQQQCLKDLPACTFASMLATDPPTQYLATQFGNVPKGCVLSYQAIEYNKPRASRESPSTPFPAVLIENAPCVFNNIRSEEEHT